MKHRSSGLRGVRSRVRQPSFARAGPPIGREQLVGEGGGIYSFSSVFNLVASTVKGNKASTDSDDRFNGP